MTPQEPQEPQEKVTARFVANILVHIPSPFPKTPEAIQEYSKYSQNDFDYYVSSKASEKKFSGKKNTVSTRGKVNEEIEIIAPTNGGFDLTPLINKFSSEAFGESAESSGSIASSDLKIVFLFNRMESLEEAHNKMKYQCHPLQSPIRYKVLQTLWRPIWKRRYFVKGDRAEGSGTITSFKRVKKYYDSLLREDPQKAFAFLYYNEHSSLNSCVPYNALRETLLISKPTKFFVKEFRKEFPNEPVYLAFLDDDTLSYRTGPMGTFSEYQIAIRQFVAENNDFPWFLTSGYSVSWPQHPCLSLAVSLDLAIRRAMGKNFPLAPYYPEPNTIVIVPPNTLTLPGSFRKENESSPSEIPTLISSIIEDCFEGDQLIAARGCVFLDKGDIETTLPKRFFYHKNSRGQNRKKFPDLNQSFALSSQNFKDIRSIPQSHLWPKEWGGYIQRFLEKKQRNEITCGEVKLTSLKEKANFIISILSTLYTYHSPVSLLIQRSQDFDYNGLIGFIHKARKNYNSLLQPVIQWTYGDNYNNKKAKRIGSFLKKSIITIDKVPYLLDSFYSKNQIFGKQIVDCARKCAFAEIEALSLFIQQRHISSPSYVIKNPLLKEEEKFAPHPSPPINTSRVTRSHRSKQTKGQMDNPNLIHTSPQMFLMTVAARYKEAMKNADAKRGEVLWGGDLELGALANIFKLKVTVFKNHNTNIIGPENQIEVFLRLAGNHYSVCDRNGKIIQNVAADGNCLFSCLFFSIHRSLPSLGELADLRRQSVEELTDESIRQRFQLVLNAQDKLHRNGFSKDLPSSQLLSEARSLGQFKSPLISTPSPIPSPSLSPIPALSSLKTSQKSGLVNSSQRRRETNTPQQSPLEELQKIMRDLRKRGFKQVEVIKMIAPKIKIGTNSTNIYRSLYDGKRRDTTVEECLNNFKKKSFQDA